MIIGILNKDITISHEIEIICPFGCFKGHVIMKSMVVIIPIMEFDISSLEVEYVN